MCFSAQYHSILKYVIALSFKGNQHYNSIFSLQKQQKKSVLDFFCNITDYIYYIEATLFINV